MKRLVYIAAVVAFVAIAMSACKTNEANYRAAYEKVKEKETDTGDSLTTAMLRKSQEPQTMTFNENGKRYALPILTVPVARKVDAGSQEGLRRYCVATGRFKQVFNAKSMCERLVGLGYDEACVVHDRQNYYYVVAASTDSPATASELLIKVNSDASLALRSPFPYILRPAHLVR